MILLRANRQFDFFIYTFAFILFLVISLPSIAQTELVRNDNANPLQRFSVASSRQSHPAFVDIDNDGDLDCFSGEFNYSKNGVVNSHITFYKNEGDDKHPLFQEVKGISNPMFAAAITGLLIPEFVDIDKDGDEDCFVANNAGAITFYKNKGTANKPLFSKQPAAFNPLSGVKFSGVDISSFVMIDADGDGDVDCLITDEEGNEAFFLNTGSAGKSHFVSMDKNDPFSFMKSMAVTTLSPYDRNKDGRMDLFINGICYQNNAGHFSTVSSATFSTNNNEVSACFVDLNKNGVPEVISGTGDGKFIYRTAAVASAKAMMSILVSPNPTTKSFTVLFTFSNEKRMLKVVNADGKTVLSQSINTGLYTFGDNFVPGIYFVQVMSANHKISEQKIIKQ